MNMCTSPCVWMDLENLSGSTNYVWQQLQRSVRTGSTYCISACCEIHLRTWSSVENARIPKKELLCNQIPAVHPPWKFCSTTRNHRRCICWTPRTSRRKHINHCAGNILWMVTPKPSKNCLFLSGNHRFLGHAKRTQSQVYFLNWIRHNFLF